MDAERFPVHEAAHDALAMRPPDPDGKAAEGSHGGLETFSAFGPGGPETSWTLRATWFFVILGIAVRLVRYLVNYPIWHDEAFLAVNFWDRSYSDLLRPLDYGQVAPWLFLVIERTLVPALGYSEPVLRLFPMLCSALSVPLFARIASRLLSAVPRLLAVGVFAVAFYPIRHGAEIKPYASDLLAALVLLALAIEARRSQHAGWWWLLSALVPILVALSYPAVFVAGGISLALGAWALRSGRRPLRLGFLVYNIVLAASFLSFYLAFTVFQAEAMRESYRNGCWANAFPPLDRPWLVPLWLLDVHTGTMMAYPAGEKHGGSTLTLLCVLSGALALYRNKQRSALALALAPFGLGLLAAILGRYPYGGAPRVMMYTAPAVCLLTGLGMAVLLARLPRDRLRRRSLTGIVTVLAVFGGLLAARDLVLPWRVPEDARTREFARWFWTAQSGSAPVCLWTDLGMCDDPGLWSVGMSAVYLFHQRMFSSRHQARWKPDLDPRSYSETKPLRLVAFDRLPVGSAGYRQWLTALERRFEVRQTSTYQIQPGKPGEDWLRDAYVVLDLVPRRAGSDTEQKFRLLGSRPVPSATR